MKKRFLSILLMLAMILACFPAGAAASSADTITVYVTISDQGVLAADKNGEPMGYRAVTVSDSDGDGTISIFDAYDTVHDLYCTSEFLLNGGGLVGQLWGDHSGAFLTYINNSGIQGNPLKEQAITNGSHLVGIILKDTSYYSDCYSYFDSAAKEVAKGTEFTLTLKGRTGMSSNADAALSGLSIGTWNNGSFTAISGKTTNQNGQVTLSFDTAGTYYVTADGTVASTSSITNRAPIVAPVCVVKVTEEKTDAEYVTDDKASLNINYVHGQDLSLPRQGNSGKTIITWISDKPTVISNTGVVTGQEEDTVVTLTATITCNNESATREFQVTVPGRLNGAKAALESVIFHPVEFTNATDAGYQYSSAAKDTNILTLIRDTVSDNDITVAFADNFTSDALIAADGTITYPVDDTRRVILPVKLTFNEQSIDVNVTAVIPKHAQTKTEAIEAMKAVLGEYLNDPKVLNGNTSLDNVRTTLLLPAGKSTGMYIKWTSSNTKVIANQTSYSKIVGSPGHPTGGYYEIPVMRPGSEDATITLTAEMTYRSTSVDLPAGPQPSLAADRKVSFTIKVPALTETEREAIVNGAAADIKIFDKDGAAADITNIKDNLYFPQYNGFTTKWTTDIAGIAIPSSGYGKAVVTRPEKGEADLVGTITLTITAGDAVESKTFDAKVLAWTESDLTAAQNQLNQVAEELTFDVMKGDNSSASAIHSNLFLKRFASIADGTVSLEHMTKSDANAWPIAITWEITPSNGPITYNDRQANKGTGIVTTPAEDTEVSLKATINYRTEIPGVTPVEKTLTVTVLSEKTAELLSLIDNIAAGYTNSSSDWEVMDMGAYSGLFPASVSKTSDDARQTLINNTIDMLTTGKNASGYDAGAGDYAKAILALAASGIDPAQLYAVNSNTTLSVVSKLDPVATASASAWTAPYVLQAYQQGSYNSTAFETELVDALLESQNDENGAWDEFGTIDTTANVIAALSLYKDRPEVQAAIDKAVAYLASSQLNDGTFDDGQTTDWAAGSNANSTAMVIIGLAANGIDPSSDDRFIKSGDSLLQSFIDAFALVSNDGFGFTDFTERNNYATEQGFRALVAAYGVMSTNAAYNVYDFSGKTLVPGRATGAGEVTPPEDEPTGTTEITVSVTIKGADSGDYWLNKKSVKVGQGSTVYHAFLKALEGSGITQVGAASGYVQSMTKDGVTLEQFGTGPNSGWLYKVNDVRVSVGLTDCELADGDNIVWYFTNDWTKEPGAEAFGGGAAPNKDKEKEEKPADMPQFSDFTDLNKDQWYCEAVEYVLSNGLMQGTSKDLFKPDAKLSRSMLVQILYNMKDKPESAASLTFGDVSSDSWYADAVHWAAENKLITGYNNGDFGPNDDITREQLAVILYRYANMEKMDTAAKGDLNAFADSMKVNSWAEDAVKWAQGNKIINGKPGQILDPQGTATRAEVAQVLLNFAELISK